MPNAKAEVWLSVKHGPIGPRAVNRTAIAATPPTIRPRAIFSIGLIEFIHILAPCIG